MKTKLKKAISWLLLTALLVQQLPMEALAVDNDPILPKNDDGTVMEIVNDGRADDAYIVGEVYEAREEYAKHYRMSDGSFVATQFEVPIHYEEDGEWVDIDNTLEPVSLYDGTETYQAVNGDNMQAFAADLSDGTIMAIAQEESSITMSLWDGTSENTAVSTGLMEESTSTMATVPDETAEEDASVGIDTSTEAPGIDSVDAEDEEATESDEEDASIDEAEASNTPTEDEVTEEETEDSTETENTTEQEDTVEDAEEPVFSTFNRDVNAEIMEINDSDDSNSVDPTSSTTDFIPETLSSTVLYANVYPNVDLRYDTFSYNVKESIILNAPVGTESTAGNMSEEITTAAADPYTYAFLLELTNLTPEMQDDGSISLLDDSDEILYTIPAPYMMDSNGEYSDAVSYTLTEHGENFLLTVQADAAWLENEDRAYPVTIDPTILSQKNESNFVGGTAAQYSSSTSVSKTQMASGYHSTHGKMEAYFKISNLPTIDAGCTVIDAIVGLQMVDYIPQYNESAKSTLQIHQVTEARTGTAWLSSLTWATKPAYSAAMDYVTTNGGEIGSYRQWNITRAAKEWYEDPSTNYGLAITSDQTASTAYRAWFGYSTTAVLIISYRNTTGLEDYYTYETQSIGRAGDGYVGDYSSALTLEKSDLGYSNTAMSFSLSHVFNSGLRNGNISDAVQSGMTAPDYSKMQTGYGWQLSVQESVKSTTIGSSSYVVYRDGDGTQHFFAGSGNYTGAVYTDEDGLGMKITFGTENGYRTYTLSDEDGNSKYFYQGYLLYMKDGNNNRIYLTYNGAAYSSSSTSWYPNESGNQLTGIYSVNSGKSATKICSFTYNSSNYLSTIVDYAGRTTSFTYSNGKLTQVTHPDGTIVYYTYDNSTSHMLRAYDGEGNYGVEYSYTGDGVSSIKEYTATSNSGSRTYGSQVKRQKNGIQEAVYQYDGDDRSFGSSDDIYTRYAFDYTGRTINATTLNYDQSEILGVTAAAYTTSSGTSATNNRVEKDAQSGQNGINLLQYGGLEPHDGFTGVTSYWTKLSGSTANNNAVVKTGELVRTGSYALKTYVNSSATTKKIGIGQSVSLQANVTYTFSAYVNTQKVTSFDQSGGAYVAFLNSSGTEVATGDKVTYQTSNNIESGWQRVYVTYTPKTAGTYRCVAMQSDAYGSAYFDDLQLEVGSVPSSVNLLQNGNFSVTQTDSSGYTSPVEWTAKNLYIYPRTDDSSNNTSYLWGDAAGMKRGWQEIPIGKEAKDTYLLSGWAYAHSAADTESSLTDTTAENNAKRYFGLIARCNYSDGTKEYFYMPFNDDYVGWQYASCVIVPKQANQSKTLSSITVITAYDCNINGAAFDNLSLRQEPCTTYTYDSKGNVTAVNATSNSSSAFSYAAGTTKLTKSTTGADGTYIYTYDYGDSRNDHLVTKITNDNVSMNITYDAMGNSTGTVLKSDSSTSAKQLQTSATYSTDGSQLLSQTNANGQTTKYAYSSNTRMLTATTDAAGTTYTSTYNANNDRANMSYISGVVSVDYGYNKGLLSTIKRGGYLPGDTTTKKSQTYNIGYDSFGNMTSIAVGSRTLASYAYGSNNNNLQSMTYGNGTVVSYTYDNLDRVTEEYWDNTLKYEYSYSAEGYLAKKLDVTTGKAVNYEYDGLGRLIHSYQTCNGTVLQRTEHTYDTDNRLHTQSWQLGDTTYSESYTYSTSDGSLSSMTPAVGSAISFTYDALKRLAKRANGIYTQSYTYADISNSTRTTTQVSSLSYAKVGNNSLSAFTLNYTYDNVGNIASVNSSAWSSQNATYTYDQQGQLTSETNTKGTYNYSFDTYGNIRSVSGAETHTYTYGNSDWLDLLTAYDGQSITYDTIGNPLSYYNGTRWTFTWKNGRQLATAAKSGTSISYTYDVTGIRDSKTVGSTTYNYITQNGQVVRQTWGSNTLDIIYDNQSSPYAFVYNGTTYYYVLNLQGDVIRVVNSSGGTVASYVYDAWGKIVSSSGSMATVNPLRYRGYYYDTESGLYYLGSRYYDPVVKRFINADSASLVTANPYGLTDKNLFSYCDNDPISRKDDGGTIWEKIAVGAAVGGITGAFWGGVTAAATGDSIAKGILWGAVSGAFSGGISAAIDEITVIGTATKVVAGAVNGGVSAVAAYKGAGNANIAGTISAAVTGAASGALSAVVPNEPLANAVVTHFSSGVSNIATMISSTVYKATKCKNTSAILVRNRTNRRNTSASAKRTTRNRNYRYRYSKRSTV